MVRPRPPHTQGGGTTARCSRGEGVVPRTRVCTAGACTPSLVACCKATKVRRSFSLTLPCSASSPVQCHVCFQVFSCHEGAGQALVRGLRRRRLVRGLRRRRGQGGGQGQQRKRTRRRRDIRVCAVCRIRLHSPCWPGQRDQPTVVAAAPVEKGRMHKARAGHSCESVRRACPPPLCHHHITLITAASQRYFS